VVAQTAQNTTKLPLGSCTPDIPCANGACCDGKSGFCGFGPNFCGSDVRMPCHLAFSYLRVLGLGLHFSRFPMLKILRGHYLISAQNYSLTHVNYAFALISSSYEITEMTAGDSDLWKRTTALKENLPALKVFLSIGGWTFNDPPNQKIFSDMVASEANTNAFLASALSVMEQYAFDGLDIDWEYPGASDRGGVPADTENYVKFMATVKAAFKVKNYGLSFTAPSSYWYLQHFDLGGLLKSADWVNVMTYDLHGVWDGIDQRSISTGESTVRIRHGQGDLLTPLFSVDPSQVVMGMAFYGRSFTLSSSDCSDPGCPWSSGADAGPCSNNVGSLMWAEINAIVGPDTQAVIQTDPVAATNYAVFGSELNQWVSYDDVTSEPPNHTLADPFPWTNCAWQGTPPFCGDNWCEIGQITVFQDPIGDGTSPCTGGNVRSYCCDVPQALPVPFSDIFPSNVEDTGNDLFNVDFDPDQGDSFSEEGTTSTFKEDDNENNSAFGEVFIDSPNPSSVSSLDVTEGWVLSGCDAKSDQAQTVVAHCSTNSDACQHVFIGGAANTIVKLPLSCGLGPYARVVSMNPHANQSVLARYRRTASGTVYSLSFDYNFAAIPAENGPVYMRADVTDMPDYWDSVVDSPPERLPRLKSRGLWKEPPKKRWWGAFKTWLSKLNQIESDNSQSRTFFWSDTWTIFHQDLHCDGPPAFDASLDISVNGQTQLTTRYGFYLQGQVVPPQVTAAYVYFDAGGKAAATFTMTGTASVTWNSDTIQFASFGFPGLYYPGLLTIGPSLVLNGYITGELSLTGTLTTGLTYQFPDIHYALGKSGDDDMGSDVTPSEPNQSYKYNFGYNVDLSGSLNIHIVPTAQLGISVLGGSLIDANAYVAADLYAGVEITGSVSHAQAGEVCVNPHYGLILTGGVTGNLLYWESSPLSIEFYNKDYTYMSKCFNSVDEPSASSRRGLGELSASAGTLPSFPAIHSEPRIVVENKSGRSQIRPSSGTLEKRVLLPPLVGTDFLCPQTDSAIGEENYDNDIYSDGA
ncbi:glycosyl hydrolases family 18-domain-containing protein, partial [Mycena metata]